MKSLAIIRGVATGFGIFAGASLLFWTGAESYLVGPGSVGLSDAWYGLVNVAVVTLAGASSTIAGVLHITDYAAQMTKPGE